MGCRVTSLSGLVNWPPSSGWSQEESTLRHLRNVTWHVFSPSYHYLGLSKNGVPPNPVVSSLEPRLFTWPHLGFLVKSYRAQQKMSMPYGSPEISHSPGSPPLDPAGSLIFVQELAEKLVKIVEPRRDQLDACLCFPSMPEATRDCGWLEGLSPEKTWNRTISLIHGLIALSTFAARIHSKGRAKKYWYIIAIYKFKIYMYYICRLRYSTTFTKAILLFILQQVMKQNKLGTFDLTQIAGGPLGNFAQQAQGESWGWVETHMLHIQYTNEEYIIIYIYT